MDFVFPEVKKIARTLLVLDACCVAAAWLWGALDYTVLIGIGYGFLFCILYFMLLGSVVKNALDRPAAQAQKFLRINYFTRYLLLGVILTIAFLSKHVNPWCVCVSFLAPKITYTLAGFRDYFRDRFGLSEHKPPSAGHTSGPEKRLPSGGKREAEKKEG